MNATTALRLLLDLRTPVVTTSDAVALLRLSTPAATRTLGRLASAGLVRRLRRGLWGLGPSIDPYVLAGYIAAPSPAYVSLPSALYLHGLTEQIPAVVYVISLGRSQRVRTSIATFSVHHVAPEMFGGFEVDARSGIRLATPEKALADVLYLSGTRSRLFAALPEIELPPRFRWSTVRAWLRRAPSSRLRAMGLERLASLRRRG